jgi:mRNA-degrading endonuclease RelE of RelBE toxin-antitoxin system
MTPVEEKFILRVPDDVASVLRKLHPVIKSHIRFGLSRVLENPYCGKALKEKLQGLRSYKIKRYRIIYRIHPEKQHIENCCYRTSKNHIRRNISDFEQGIKKKL